MTGSTWYEGDEYKPTDTIGIGKKADTSSSFTPLKLGSGDLIFAVKGLDDSTKTLPVSIGVEANAVAISLRA